MVKKGATAPQVTDLWPIVEQIMKKQKKFITPTSRRVALCNKAKVARPASDDPLYGVELVGLKAVFSF